LTIYLVGSSIYRDHVNNAFEYACKSQSGTVYYSLKNPFEPLCYITESTLDHLKTEVYPNTYRERNGVMKPFVTGE
jgi:hypothetical protein